MSNVIIGQHIGAYYIERLLGHGVRSDIFLAQDMAKERPVALKLMTEQLAADSRSTPRFMAAESRQAHNLQRRHLVTVHESGQWGNRPYLVMEYLEGSSLAEVIRDEGVWSPLRTARLISHIATVLDYAHSQGVLRRDLKSSSVIISPDGHVTLTDFGLIQDPSGTRQPQSNLPLAALAYLSPEQVRGEAATPLSDVYSLGVLAYEALSGRLPFQADNHAALNHQILDAPPPLLDEINPAVPKAVATVIDWALSKDPTERYPTVGQFAWALTLAANDGQTVMEPIRVTPEAEPDPAATPSPTTTPPPFQSRVALDTPPAAVGPVRQPEPVLPSASSPTAPRVPTQSAPPPVIPPTAPRAEPALRPSRRWLWIIVGIIAVLLTMCIILAAVAIPFIRDNLLSVSPTPVARSQAAPTIALPTRVPSATATPRPTSAVSPTPTLTRTTAATATVAVTNTPTPRPVTADSPAADWNTWLAASPDLNHPAPPSAGAADLGPYVEAKTAPAKGFADTQGLRRVDLGEDGRNEVVILLREGAGGPIRGLLVFTFNERGPVLLKSLAGDIVDVTVDKGQLVVSQALYAGWEPAGNPSGVEDTRYTLQGNELVVAGTPTSRGLPEMRETTVRKFYELMRDKNFEAAYAFFGPTVRQRNPRPTWEATYRNTVTLTETIRVNPDGSMTVTIVAKERVGTAQVDRRYSSRIVLAWNAEAKQWLFNEYNLQRLS